MALNGKKESGLTYRYGEGYSKLDSFLNRKAIYGDRIFTIIKIEKIGDANRSRNYLIRVDDGNGDISISGDAEINTFSLALKFYSDQEYEDTLIDIENIKTIVGDFVGKKCIWGVHLLQIQSISMIGGVFEIISDKDGSVIKKTVEEAIRFANDLKPYNGENIKHGKVALISDDDHEEMKINEDIQDLLSMGLTPKNSGVATNQLPFIICCYCGLRSYSFNVEHLIPTSKGGLNIDENRRSCCIKCNSEKGAMQLPDYLFQCYTLSINNPKYPKEKVNNIIKLINEVLDSRVCVFKDKWHYDYFITSCARIEKQINTLKGFIPLSLKINSSQIQEPTMEENKDLETINNKLSENGNLQTTLTLKEILLDNIKNIKTNPMYIPQAQEISKQVGQVINVLRTEMECIRLAQSLSDDSSK